MCNVVVYEDASDASKVESRAYTTIQGYDAPDVLALFYAWYSQDDLVPASLFDEIVHSNMSLADKVTLFHTLVKTCRIKHIFIGAADSLPSQERTQK
jgi:hypothetical protein